MAEPDGSAAEAAAVIDKEEELLYGAAEEETPAPVKDAIAETGAKPNPVPEVMASDASNAVPKKEEPPVKPEEAVQASEDKVAGDGNAKEDTEVEVDKDAGDEDNDDDCEEDDDDDSDSDFDVVIEQDPETLNGAKPGAASTIGNVRVASNNTRFVRPGFVPPERVITAPTAGGRAGGVLSMLPTPTMQIGTTQKSVYDLEIGKLTEKPWLDRNADLVDYFNYGFNEESWKLYCERQMQMRLEASNLAKIKTHGHKPATQIQPSVQPSTNAPQRMQGQRSTPPPPPPSHPAPNVGRGAPRHQPGGKMQPMPMQPVHPQMMMGRGASMGGPWGRGPGGKVPPPPPPGVWPVFPSPFPPGFHPQMQQNMRNFPQQMAMKGGPNANMPPHGQQGGGGRFGPGMQRPGMQQQQRPGMQQQQRPGMQQQQQRPGMQQQQQQQQQQMQHHNRGGNRQDERYPRKRGRGEAEGGDRRYSSNDRGSDRHYRDDRGSDRGGDRGDRRNSRGNRGQDHDGYGSRDRGYSRRDDDRRRNDRDNDGRGGSYHKRRRDDRYN